MVRSEAMKVRVLAEIDRQDAGEGVSGPSVAEALGLAGGVVRDCLVQLVGDGRLTWVGMGEAKGGRPPKLYRRLPITAAGMQPDERPTSADVAEQEGVA